MKLHPGIDTYTLPPLGQIIELVLVTADGSPKCYLEQTNPAEMARLQATPLAVQLRSPILGFPTKYSIQNQFPRSDPDHIGPWFATVLKVWPCPGSEFHLRGRYFEPAKDFSSLEIGVVLKPVRTPWWRRWLSGAALFLMELTALAGI